MLYVCIQTQRIASKSIKTHYFFFFLCRRYFSSTSVSIFWICAHVFGFCHGHQHRVHWLEVKYRKFPAISNHRNTHRMLFKFILFFLSLTLRLRYVFKFISNGHLQQTRTHSNWFWIYHLSLSYVCCYWSAHIKWIIWFVHSFSVYISFCSKKLKYFQLSFIGFVFISGIFHSKRNVDSVSMCFFLFICIKDYSMRALAKWWIGKSVMVYVERHLQSVLHNILPSIDNIVQKRAYDRALYYHSFS